MRNESSEGNDSCPIPGTIPDRVSGGGTDVRWKHGDQETADSDFDNLNPSDVKTVIKKDGSRVRVGTLPGGKTVVVRPSEAGPTIELQWGGRSRIEVKYGP